MVDTPTPVPHSHQSGGRGVIMSPPPSALRFGLNNDRPSAVRTMLLILRGGRGGINPNCAGGFSHPTSKGKHQAFAIAIRGAVKDPAFQTAGGGGKRKLKRKKRTRKQRRRKRRTVQRRKRKNKTKKRRKTYKKHQQKVKKSKKKVHKSLT